MGFYTDMLREDGEFLGNPGFDDDAIVGPNDEYTQDLNDIAKAIEDINDKQAKESSEVELDGQDIREESFQFMYESQYNWNRIMQAIGEAELAEEAKGKKFSFKDVDVKGFFAKAKQLVVAAWEKLTATVKKFIDEMDKKIGASNVGFIAKNEKAIRDGYDNFNKEFKGFDFKGTSDLDTKFYDRCAKTFKIAQDAFTSKVDVAVAGNGDPASVKEKLSEKVTSFEDTVKSYLNIENTESVSDYFDTGKKAKLTRENTCMKPDYIINTLKNSKDYKAKVKGIYAAAKACYKSMLKDIARLEKAFSTVSTEQQALMGVCTNLVNEARKNQNLAHAMYTSYMHSLNTEIAQARRVANAYVALAQQAAKESKKAHKQYEKEQKKAQHESGLYQGAGFLAGLNMNMI